MMFPPKPNEFLITTTLHNHQLKFITTHDLFSFRKIDAGTKLLIDSLQVNPGDTCLDLGCGYGAIGITIARLNPGGQIYFLDRDFVAVDYTKKNCQLNQISNFHALVSDGLSHIDKDLKFNLIASNLPSHTSNQSLIRMISDSKKHLQPTGQLFVVTVNKLKPFIQRQFKTTFGNYKNLAHSSTHTISLSRKIKTSTIP